MEHGTLRAIVDLLPGYALARRSGWVPQLTAPGGRVSQPEYVLLRRVAIEPDDQPITDAGLRASLLNPYAVVDPFLDLLPGLVELGLLERSGERYALTRSAVELLRHGERAANDYAAARVGLPAADLERLASTLGEVAARLLGAPEPAVKEHQERVARLRRFDTRDLPPVRLEYAIYALQRARDDAHLAAWRAAGFRGPPFELLSRVWAGQASTAEQLAGLVRDLMSPSDVELLLGELECDGLVTLQASVALTGRGRSIREAIERETDRVYFAPWPELDAAWIRDRLAAVATSLAQGLKPLAEETKPPKGV